MMPAPLPLSLYRGDTTRWQFKLWADAEKTQAVDLTGASAKAQIRDKPLPDGQLKGELTCVVTLPNIIDAVLAPEVSRDLPKKGYWDLQLTYASGDIATVLAGPVEVTSDVTEVGAP